MIMIRKKGSLEIDGKRICMKKKICLKKKDEMKKWRKKEKIT